MRAAIQEKYTALADLRRFQAAAGARDLCAFLEGLPEVTLQRKQGALLVRLFSPPVPGPFNLHPHPPCTSCLTDDRSFVVVLCTCRRS